MVVMLAHPRSGDRRPVSLGWNWSFLLFAGFLGLPLFRAGLTLWGAAILVVWGLGLMLPFIAPDLAASPILLLLPGLALLGLTLFVTVEGNAMIARRCFRLGYTFAKPDSLEARQARDKWRLG